MRIIGDLVLAGFGQLKNARIENLSTDPGAPQNGQVWFNTTDNVYRGFNGTEVITFATGGNTQLILDQLAAETSARQAADTALTNALNAETTARTNADTTLQANIDAEATARTSGDATNAAAIAAETTARTAADTTLQNNLNTETTARIAGDAANASAIAAEETARIAGDDTNAGLIAAEETARIAAVTAEAAARTAADTTLRTDFIAADAVVASDAAAATAAEASARAAADALRVLKSGDSMTGNLAFGGVATVTGLTAPVAADDAANKNYVDSMVSGLSWKQAVDVAVANHVGESTANGYRVLNLTDGKIYTGNGAGFNAGVAAADGDAVFDKATETGYVYSGTAWTQFTGTGQVAAGVGLSKTGNQLDVNLGAGIAQLPSDEVGVDVRATGGLYLTLDGSTPSDDTAAQLAIRLADSSLTLGASGVQVSAGLQSELSAATAAIAAETSARIAADNTETSARTAADTALTNSLAAETTARQDADGVLSAAIATEESARIAADNAASAALAAETTARTSADTTLTNNLAAEVTNRQAADGTLQSNIDAEATARAAADTAETSARTAADTALSDRINAGYFLYDGAVAATSHTVTHNIGKKYCVVQVVDSNDKAIIPDAITFTDSNSLVVDFISAITCKVVVMAAKA